jgi:HAD superfamily hydrolase (TIGR01458 family)
MTAPHGILLDIDGVLTISWRALPGAVDAVARLRAAEYRLGFVTNTTSRTREVLSETLLRAGFDITPREILTAATATADYLRRAYPGKRCFLLTSGEVGRDFAGIEVTGPGEPADVVVIGGAGGEFSHDSLDHAFQLLQQGAPLVAMHRNLFWRRGNRLTLDSGGYILGMEKASGVQATVVGKPAASFYELALSALGLPAAQTVMVGDDIEADIQGAKNAGLSAVLLRTGKFRAADLERSTTVPDAVLDSIADLPDWLDSAPKP